MSNLRMIFPSPQRVEMQIAGIQGPAGGGGGAGTDLSYNAASRTLASSTGADVVLPLADGTTAGLMSSASVIALASALQPGAAIPWADISGKPATFPPSTHGHVIADVTGLQTALDGKQANLGFTPEDSAQKGVAGGYAGLDGTGKVPSSQLPSFVDDVLEFANLASFPGTGETGKMYIAIDTGRVYRWSGSVYVEISGSPGSTDAVPEGSGNLYHTAARVRGTDLSSYALGSRVALAASDTIVGAFNKIGKWLSDLAAVAFTGSAGDLTTGTLPTARIADASLGLGKLANIATARLLGRTTAGSGVTEEVSGTQVTAMLDVASTSAKGLVPVLPGGTDTFFRGDGTFAAPAGGGGGSVAIENEGTSITLAATDIDFVGLGVHVTGGASATVTILGLIAAAPSSDQADWNPAGFNAGTAVIKMQPTTNAYISGIAAGANDQILTLVNDSDFLIGLTREDAASTAANRIRKGNMPTLYILPQEALELRYSATLARWVPVDWSLDPTLPTPRSSVFVPQNGATVNALGISGLTTQATVSTIAPLSSPTDPFTEYLSWQITNATAAGTSSVRNNNLVFHRGGTAGRQGFFHTGLVRFTAQSATGSVRAGLMSSTGVSTATNAATTYCLFLGADPGQTNLRIFFGGASAGTPIDLGANFPTPSATACYEYAFYLAGGGSTVQYMVRRLDTRFVAQGSLTTNIPDTANRLGHRTEVSVGATAAATTMQGAYLITMGL